MIDKFIERTFYILSGGIVGFWFGYMGCKIFSRQNKNTKCINMPSIKTEGTGSGDNYSPKTNKTKEKSQ